MRPKINYQRRMGDSIRIPGDYQHRILNTGPAPQRFWHYAKYQEAMHWLAPESGDVILDLGCGSGVAASMFAQTDGTRVLGIDTKEGAVRYARNRFRASNLAFVVGSVDELGLGNESVDKIALLEVIEHLYLEQAARTVSECSRVLKPGGRLVVTTPNMNSLWPVIEWVLDLLRLVPNLKGDQHVNGFNALGLIALAEHLELKVVTCRTIHLMAPWLAILSWQLALHVHRMEQRWSNRFGNLLLACFEKQPSAA